MTPDNLTQKNSVLDRFDKILFKHLERLIGSSYGIGGLPLNSATISCLILLMDREKEIESFPSDPSVRYTSETLVSELEELGFSRYNDMFPVIQDMVKKGYINVSDNDQFVPEKPAVSMAKLLDRTFPGMPGMNLVGYLIQTIDEVNSERKDLDSAIRQYDQTLKIQGVPLTKGALSSKTSKVTKQSKERKIKVEKQDILGRPRNDRWRNEIRVLPSEPKFLSSDSYKGKVKKIGFGKTFIEEDETDEIRPHPDKNVENEMQTTREELEDTQTDNDGPESSDSNFVMSSKYLKAEDFDSQSPCVSLTIKKVSMDDRTFSVGASFHDRTSVEQEKNFFDNNEDDSSKATQTPNQQKNQKETSEDAPEADDIKKEGECIDDDISRRISAFEKDLAMECPICRHSKVQVEKTAMGKSYYKCSNKNCNFISWGKPYHIRCHQCNNPFLVEATKAGKTILKCPRATCRYWQKKLFNIIENQQETLDSEGERTGKVTSISRKPRKRVVRRRVVRRKR